MAQQPLPYGLIDNDPDHTNDITLREAFKRIGEMHSDHYSLQSTIVSSGDFQFAGELTNEEKIEAACVFAESIGKTVVAIPANQIPHDTTLIGAHTSLRRVREGADYAVYDVQAYGTIGGAGDAGPAFRTALAGIAAACGGGLKVPRATYEFTILNDTDSIQLPSNLVMDCTSGPTFLWGDLGSPLFVAVNKDNIVIDGPTFEWNGTLVDVPGTAARFGSSLTLNNRDYCCHVLSLGSNNVRIRNAATRTQGDAPTLATQAFLMFTGFFPWDTVTSNTGNAVEECAIDDVIQGVLMASQDKFRFTRITSRRFPGDHPVGGGTGINGHLIYTTNVGGPRSAGLVVRDIVDHGVPVGNVSSTRADNSVQMIRCSGAIVSGITSKRPTGMFHFDGFINGKVSDAVWTPIASASAQQGLTSIGTADGTGLADSSLTGIVCYLNDNTDIAAFHFRSSSRNKIDIYISASHTTDSIGSGIMTTCVDNRVTIDYLARNSTSVKPVGFITASHRNQVDIVPIGQNHKLRPFNETGCLDNVVRLRDNVSGKWSERSHWTTEADSPAIGFESIKKSKVYRIGTSTDPTTTLQLPRAGVWVGTVQIIEASGAHLRGGYYRIVWDAGALQSVELLGTQWTVGASPPTVLNLAVSAAGVVTVTTTAPNASWDIVYDFQSLGNNRYADY